MTKNILINQIENHIENDMLTHQFQYDPDTMQIDRVSWDNDTLTNLDFIYAIGYFYLYFSTKDRMLHGVGGTVSNDNWIIENVELPNIPFQNISIQNELSGDYLPMNNDVKIIFDNQHNRLIQMDSLVDIKNVEYFKILNNLYILGENSRIIGVLFDDLKISNNSKNN